MSDFEVARAIAHIAHRGQTDKAGHPYIGHPARVADRVFREDRDVPYLSAAVAWLHDVLEDTDVTAQDLADAGVSVRVVGIVKLLTRGPAEQPEAYYARIATDSVAVRVKFAEIADNSDSARLDLLDDATVVRLTRKYAKARRLLGAGS